MVAAAQVGFALLPHDSRENSRGESLDAAAEVGILVGYQDNGSGYRVYFPDRRGGKGSVLTRRDLKFCKPGTAPPEEGDERFQARRRHEMMTGTCRPTRPPFLLDDAGGSFLSPFSGSLPGVLSASAPVGALGDAKADTKSITASTPVGASSGVTATMPVVSSTPVGAPVAVQQSTVNLQRAVQEPTRT